ncbi:MAG: OmpH family outer membrane protein [Methylocystaceae bacterium]|nr:OmpH family outer membrane protein [Methylocystaceae bacterium]
MNFKSILLPACAITLSLIFSFSSTAKAQEVPLNVAVVNFQKVMAVSAAPKNVREQVKAIREQYRTEVQKEEAELLKANQDLAQKQSLLSPESFKEERRKFEQKVREVQKKVQQKNLDLQKAQNEALEKINQNLREVVLKIAADKGYSLVLRRENTVVVADKYDISDEVIKQLNAKLPSIKVFK